LNVALNNNKTCHQVIRYNWYIVESGEERISEGLTARSFLIKAIFASSPAVVGLDILVAVYIN
jgi:hypothetical protein